MVNCVQGKLDNVFTFRLTPGTDVLKAIIDICTEHNIKDGYIMSALGSWRKATICNPTNLPNGKVGYGEPTVMEGNIELINLTGIICHDDDGNVFPHIHVTLSDEKANAYGGHMMPGCEVLITTDVVIGTFSGIAMSRKLDPEIGLPLFAPKSKK